MGLPCCAQAFPVPGLHSFSAVNRAVVQCLWERFTTVRGW